MSINRLVITPEQIQGDLINLDPHQLHYLLRVLRLENNDRFIALDGLGNSWIAEIADRSAKIIESIDIETELSISLSLITALPKGSGYEQVVRCCTELGVNNFIPVLSDRTILKPSHNKVQRWRKIVTEAAEQSERTIVPTVFEPVKFAAAIDNNEIIGRNKYSSVQADDSSRLKNRAQTTPVRENLDKYICIARGDIPRLWDCLRDRESSSIAIATGCEGGWTDREIEKAIASGFKPVSLGSRILRAVTAPIAVSSLVSTIDDR